MNTREPYHYALHISIFVMSSCFSFIVGRKESVDVTGIIHAVLRFPLHIKATKFLVMVFDYFGICNVFLISTFPYTYSCIYIFL